MPIGTNKNASPCDPLSVSELIQFFQSALTTHSPFVRVVGEISELSQPPSGHIYFTLSDETSSFPIVMWRGSVKELSFRPKAGLAVVVEGRPTIYNVNGKLQLVASKVIPLGNGLLQQKFLELKAKLDSEGLFSEGRKRRLPLIPRAIGIITSANGAAIHDIMTRLQDRMPAVKKYLIDVRVQGPGAAEEIAAAIERFNRLRICDVLIVGRGGGSLEDLWAFNEEAVVRAIFRSDLPVISAVGHEVDVTLSDLVADLRAPTPSAAAELVVPRADELLRNVDGLYKRLLISSDMVGLAAQRVDELARRFQAASVMRFKAYSLLLSNLESRLKILSPAALFSNSRLKVDNLINVLIQRTKQKIDGSKSLVSGYTKLLGETRAMGRIAREGLISLEHRLGALHPLRTLARGYAIARRSGVIVRDAGSVAPGEEIEIMVANGHIVSEVIRSDGGKDG